MTTVRFAYNLNSERFERAFFASERKEWSGFVYSFKIKQRQEITVC